MGYLTTITFYNDAASDLKNYPKEVTQGIYEAQAGMQLNRGVNTFHFGSHCNPVILQKPRHADDHTLYLHAGNTVIDVCNANSEWAIKEFLNQMKFHTRQLKNKLKDIQLLEKSKATN